MLFNAVIRHAEAIRKNFEATNAKPEEIVEEATSISEPLLKYLRAVSDAEFIEQFAGKYGSGGPLEYFYELAQRIWDEDRDFNPEGLSEYRASRDDQRVKEAESTIKFIESRVTEIVINYFRKLHGSNYWTYIGSKEMRVKAYERQQEDPPEKQLDLDAYLDFIDKKRIIEKADTWAAFKPYFDIPLPGEKTYSKNLRWMDRLNELRRIVAHPHKRAFKPDDLTFLEWIRKAFEEKLLSVSNEDAIAALQPRR